MTAPLKPTHCPDQKGGKSARKRNSDEDVLKLLREVELKLSEGVEIRMPLRPNFNQSERSHDVRTRNRVTSTVPEAQIGSGP